MNRWAIVLALVLAACSQGSSKTLLRDPAPQPTDRINPIAVENPLVHPPWEALVKAGPGAENDIDLETLEGPVALPPVIAAPQKLPPDQQQAVVDTPKILAKPAKKPKPGDVVITSVSVPKVTGPGGGELASAMRAVLRQAGWPVHSKPRPDALTLRGIVNLLPAKNGEQIVRITWLVSRPDGKVLGDLKQENAVPAGSLDQGWGENARFATEAAAEGLFKLIEKYR